MSVHVSSWVWKHSTATGSARLVLLAIADCADDNGSNAWPSLASIAAKARVSRSTAIRAVAELSEMGELKRIHGGGRPGRGGVSNGYRIVMVERSKKNESGGDLTPPPGVKGSQDATSSNLELVPNGSEVVSPVTPEPSLEPSKTKTRRQPPPGVGRFGEFWNAYPRRVGHNAAKTKWAIALREATADEIIAGATRYAKATHGTEARFIAHPSTWLHGGRWMDEPDQTAAVDEFRAPLP